MKQAPGNFPPPTPIDPNQMLTENPEREVLVYEDRTQNVWYQKPDNAIDFRKETAELTAGAYPGYRLSAPLRLYGKWVNPATGKVHRKDYYVLPDRNLVLIDDNPADATPFDTRPLTAHRFNASELRVTLGQSMPLERFDGILDMSGNVVAGENKGTLPIQGAILLASYTEYGELGWHSQVDTVLPKSDVTRNDAGPQNPLVAMQSRFAKEDSALIQVGK